MHRLLSQYVLVTVFVIVLLGTGNLRLHDANVSNQRWETYYEMSKVIATMPEWPTDRDWSVEEWQTATVIAAGFQREAVEDLYRALLAYMIQENAIPDAERGLAESKPMLMLRLVYEIPNDARWVKNAIYPCGGISSSPPWQRELETLSVRAPIEEDDAGKLFLSHYRVAIGGGTGPRYCPLVELGYFEQTFSRRELAVPQGATIDGWRAAREWLRSQEQE